MGFRVILGSKPLSEMSDEELFAAIEELRSQREALAAEGAKRAKPGKTKDDFIANLLKGLLDD